MSGTVSQPSTQFSQSAPLLLAVPALMRLSRNPALAGLIKSLTADAQSHRAGTGTGAERSEATLYGVLYGAVMTFNPTGGHEVAPVATALLMGYNQNWSWSGPDWLKAAANSAR